MQKDLWRFSLKALLPKLPFSFAANSIKLLLWNDSKFWDHVSPACIELVLQIYMASNIEIHGSVPIGFLFKYGTFF